MIDLVTGQPGHGKSFSAVRRIRRALERKRIVVSNVPLVDNRTQADVDAGKLPTWALTMARSNPFYWLWPGGVKKAARAYVDRFYFVDDLTHLRRMVLPPCGKCPGCRRGPGCQREARGEAILDEAHKWLNARTWDTDETGQAATKADAMRRRLEIVWFFATHRHRGWKITLITQNEATLDNQVRNLYETITRVKNVRRYKALGLFPVVPFNLFVAVTTWHDEAKSRLGCEVYLLNKRLARCYDTFGAARHMEHDSDAIFLGVDHGAERPAAGSDSSPPAAGHQDAAHEHSPEPAPTDGTSDRIPVIRAVTPLENAQGPEFVSPSLAATERDLTSRPDDLPAA